MRYDVFAQAPPVPKWVFSLSGLGAQSEHRPTFILADTGTFGFAGFDGTVYISVVPEPGLAYLLASGLVALFAVHRLRGARHDALRTSAPFEVTPAASGPPGTFELILRQREHFPLALVAAHLPLRDSAM